jgi:protein MAK16
LLLLLWRLVAACCRTEKRERRREAKAEVAARLDKAIESELLKRLQSGTYGDIYNFPLKTYEKVS